MCIKKWKIKLLFLGVPSILFGSSIHDKPQERLSSGLILLALRFVLLNSTELF